LPDALRRRYPAVRFVLVGDGPLRATPARRYPEFLFCGTRTGADLARHYASADLFLFPICSETFGNVVTEAMASGLAVVAYDLAAAGEHIRHLHNGALVQPVAPSGFSDAVLGLYADPQGVRRLGHNAADYARRLDWQQVVKRFAVLLHDAIAHVSHGQPAGA